MLLPHAQLRPRRVLPGACRDQVCGSVTHSPVLPALQSFPGKLEVWALHGFLGQVLQALWAGQVSGPVLPMENLCGSHRQRLVPSSGGHSQRGPSVGEVNLCVALPALRRAGRSVLESL